MNKTRRTWSGTYKCCMDKKDSLTAFIITASILSSIPVFFYVGLYVYGMMQNSYYEHLDGADVSGRGSINTMSARTTSNPGPSSVAASGSVAQPSSQANNSSSSSRPKNNFEDRPLPALPRSKPISNRPNMLADLDSDDETPAN